MELDLSPSSLHLLKRAQLQKYCKKLGLRGAGKNTELLQRLQDHFKQAGSREQISPRSPLLDIPDVTHEQPVARGWCVIHGQELTTARWFQLSLRCGHACVSTHGLFVPLHLVPSSKPTPPGLTDNLVCGECMERNQEKDVRLQQKSAVQGTSTVTTAQWKDEDKSCANTDLQKTRAVRASCTQSSGRFQPKEDPEYARRVDELLDQMASGQVDSQKVLQSVRPAVIHSPLGKQERSPIPINF
ncbi:uncharacterized protein [Eleutherodactylus coqui]|uniref:uncharacterized protein n=1 Tax=Eleutherodactylus coqui TaxID=57060 RepID=UPI00346218B0